MRTLTAEGDEGCNVSIFQGFIVELVGFTFLYRTRHSLCAEILILFHCSTLDQKVKGRSLGIPQALLPRLRPAQGWLWVDCVSIPNFSRSDTTSC
jgi:hypothetical protein